MVAAKVRSVVLVEGASDSAAVRALAPSTLFQLPGAGHNNFQIITALVARLPCFQLELDSDVTRVSKSLGELMEQLSSQ